MASCVVLSDKLKCIPRLLTVLRNKNTGRADFVTHAQRLMSVICEEGLSHIQSGLADVEIVTPTSSTCEGVTLDTSNLVVVSIIRAGDAMLESFLQICPEAAVGKILIQRDEETALPKLFYYKVPDLTGKQVILVDPMLATGGSAKAAIKILLDKGAPQNRIAFFNVIGCPEGVKALNEAYPGVQIITGHIDHGLNERAYIIPGLGDYGDRYFGTV